MKRYFYLFSLAVSFSAAVIGFSQTGSQATPTGQNNPIAPAFSLTSLEGEKFELAALRGKVVVLNFWFTGCAPCVAEFTKLNKLVDKFKNKEVVFIAPTLDNAATLEPFLKDHAFKYHVVPNSLSLIVNSYRDGSGNVVFPTHIVIDKEGKIETRMTGSKRVGDLRKVIARLLSTEVEKAK